MADFLEMPDKANELIIGDGSCRTYPQGKDLQAHLGGGQGQLSTLGGAKAKKIMVW